MCADTDWNSSAKPLPLPEHAQLPSAIEACGVEKIVQQKVGFYRFIANVTRRFLSVIGNNEDTDPLCLERETYLTQALEKEWEQVPVKITSTWKFEGGFPMLVKMLLPVMNFVFVLPGEGATEGSREWIQAAFSSGRYTFTHLHKYPKLMHMHVQQFIDGLDEDGKIRLYDGETVPCTNYERSPTYKYLDGVNSRSYTMHPQFFFLRKVNVQGAILDLRNSGTMPFQSDPESMPKGMPSQNNFAQAKTEFCSNYCRREGLARSSDLAREVHVYVFNGNCGVRQSGRGPKRSTIIFEVFDAL